MAAERIWVISYFELHVYKTNRGSVFECCQIRRKLLEQRFRALGAFEARPSSDFERPVAAEQGFQAECAKRHYWGGVFECGQMRRSLLEQRFRALSVIGARTSSGFERPVAAEHTRTVISTAKHAPCGVFECCPAVSSLSAHQLKRIIYYWIHIYIYIYIYRKLIDAGGPNREIGFGFVSCSCRACERAGDAKLCGRVRGVLVDARLQNAELSSCSGRALALACLLLLQRFLSKSLAFSVNRKGFNEIPSNYLLYATV